MSRKIYIGYISYWIKNIGGYVTKGEWRKFLDKKLGKSLSKTKDNILEDLALFLYYTHFAHLGLNVDVTYFMFDNITTKKLRDLVVKVNDLRKEYDIPLLPVFYSNFEKAAKHMENMQESSTILEKKLEVEEKVPVKTTKKSPKISSKKPTSTKTLKSSKSTTKSTTKLITKKSPNKSIATSTKRLSNANNANTTKINATKLAAKTISGACEKYTLIELKEMAREKNIKGRSTMKKAELCKALKLK